MQELRSELDTDLGDVDSESDSLDNDLKDVFEQGALTSSEELDDLDALKEDLDEDMQSLFDEEMAPREKSLGPPKGVLANTKESLDGGKIDRNFNIGQEERKLLELAKFIENKIPENEWTEIAANSKQEKYVVQEGQWLWKISKKLFGSGFYYAKIWSLNPYITNPHNIKPGMTLVFNTGTEINLPTIKVGGFDVDREEMEKVIKSGKKVDLSYYGDEIEANWLIERQKLKKQGKSIRYAVDGGWTIEDILDAGDGVLNTEYKKYNPPIPDIVLDSPDNNSYDRLGFDRSSKVDFDFKEGFFLNTFLSTNFVQDIGVIANSRNENLFLGFNDFVYLEMDKDLTVAPGDLYSIYSPGGKVSQKFSDRSGYRYTTTGQVKIIKKIGDKWEAKIIESSGEIRRNDRLTVYTPKIGKIFKTFNQRNIEAVIMSSFTKNSILGSGDVVYLDRGRVDGVEMGNIFEIYSFTDRALNRKITLGPTYKVGELVVITLSDNFATGLITISSNEFTNGSLAITKSLEQAARDQRASSRGSQKDLKLMEDKALEELDVELNLEDINEDLLDKADKIELTEDELEELERQERERSIIKENEKDLKALERLETEIQDAEALLNNAKIDEDKFLEDQNLDKMEKDYDAPDPNAIESLEELESEFGRKFMDEDLNSKENPYGLTGFDLEEIDDLLNSDAEDKSIE